jgi:hypothetical protein
MSQTGTELTLERGRLRVFIAAIVTEDRGNCRCVTVRRRSVGRRMCFLRPGRFAEPDRQGTDEQSKNHFGVQRRTNRQRL